MLSSLTPLYDGFPEAVLATDTTGVITYANAIAEDLFALYGGKLCGRALPELYASDASALYKQRRPDFRRPMPACSFRTTYQRCDGLTFLGDTLASPVGGGGCVFILRVATPIETTLSALQILHQITAASARASEKIDAILQLGAAFFGLPLAIQSRIDGDVYTVEHCADPDGGLQPGARFSTATTYCAHTLRNEEPVGFHHAGQSEIREHPCYQSFQLEAYLGCQLILDGTVYGTLNFSRQRSVRPFSGDDKVFVRLLADQVSHILALEQTQNELKRLALTDPLTGLANRRAVLATLDACTEPAAVLLLDLDRFKRINDTWGHDGGDIVLQWFSKLCVEVVGEAGTCGRFGGEEFLVVLPGADIIAAQALAVRLLDTMRRCPVTVQPDVLLTVSASIGAAHQHPGEHAETLIARADAAMYTAKESGRARACLAA